MGGVQISLFGVNFLWGVRENPKENFLSVLQETVGKLSIGSFLSLGREGGGVRGKSEEGY